AVQQARERQEVFHPEDGAGLTEARGALVAQQHHQAFGLRVGRERFELRAGFGIELGCRFSAQDRRQLVAYGHEPSGTRDWGEWTSMMRESGEPRKPSTAAPSLRLGGRRPILASVKIYTRAGDDGSTGLLGPGRVSKSAPRVEAYGSVDELNAAL